MNRIVMLALSALLMSGCAIVTSTARPLLQDEGEVFVYVQPFPQDAERLKFTIDSCSLGNKDGREFPLALARVDFNRSALDRQRFLAGGRVPPGQYTGLLCRITKATLTTDEGDMALLVPEEPVKILLSFDIPQKKAVVLSLAFHVAGSVQNSFSFTPQFSLQVPSLPVSGLLGYAVNRDDDTVTVFDKRTGQVSAIMTTDREPYSMVLDQQARLAYLSLEAEDAVDVIDAAEGTPVNRINLKLGDGPREVALTPDGRLLLVVNARSRILSIIDRASLLELSRIPVGDGPRNLLVGRTGQRCYVFNGLSNTVSVIDIANRAAVATISTMAGPLMGQFNRKGNRLYVVHEGSPYLSIIDPATLSLVNKVFVGQGITFIKVDSATDLLYVYRSGDARLEVLDPYSLSTIDYIPAANGIVYMTIEGETNSLFLVSADLHRLLSISLVSKKIAVEADLGANPVWLAIMGER